MGTCGVGAQVSPQADLRLERSVGPIGCALLRRSRTAGFCFGRQRVVSKQSVGALIHVGPVRTRTVRTTGLDGL